MIRSVFILALLIVSCSSDIKTAASLENKLQEGDIIFQSTQSRQCEAVKLATHSEYSHVGIIFKKMANGWYTEPFNR